MMGTNNIYAKIFALLKSIGKSNEWLHDMLEEWFCKTSLKLLSGDEYNKLIDNLEKVKRESPPVYGSRTDKQVWKINDYKNKLKMKPAELNSFIRRTTGDKDSTDTLSIADASAVITGLSKLKMKKL